MPWRILQYEEGQQTVDFTLFDAAYAGVSGAVHILLENGASVNATDEHGWTALMYAAYAGHETTAALLLEAGADATSEVGGASAAWWAMEKEHEGVVRLMLEQPR